MEKDNEVLTLMLQSIQMNKTQADASEAIIKKLLSTEEVVTEIKNEMLDLAAEIKDNIHLWPVEVIKVKTEVEIKARHIVSRRPDVSYKKAAQNIWRGVYRTFGVSSLYFIRRHDYDAVIEYIRNYQYNK